jgi:hypothetical protein
MNKGKCMSAGFVVNRFMDYSRISDVARLMLDHVLRRKSDVNRVVKATVGVISQEYLAQVNTICLKLILR